MSLEYWSMKLSGCLVKHRDDYVMIQDIHINDESYFRNYRYPEDCLPGIYFELSNGHTVAYDDFEIDFPIDRWVATGTTIRICMRGNRSLDRNYKLAPTGSNLSVYSKVRRGNILRSYLNACNRTPVYDNIFDIFQQPRTLGSSYYADYLISNNCAVVTDDEVNKSLYWRGIKIGRLQTLSVGAQRLTFSYPTGAKTLPKEYQPIANPPKTLPIRSGDFSEYFKNSKAS